MRKNVKNNRTLRTYLYIIYTYAPTICRNVILHIQVFYTYVLIKANHHPNLRLSNNNHETQSPTMAIDGDVFKYNMVTPGVKCCEWIFRQ